MGPLLNVPEQLEEEARAQAKKNKANQKRWYIVHTYSGYENKVAENIGKIVENRKMHDDILGVCIPVEKVVEVRDDKTVEVERKIFPSYVVVKLAVEYSDKEGEEGVLKVPDKTWHAIRYTSGVTGFVGPDGKPVPLTAEEVKKLGLEGNADGIGIYVFFHRANRFLCIRNPRLSYILYHTLGADSS